MTKLRTRQSRALVESFINGNRSYVADAILKEPGAVRAAMLAIRVSSALGKDEREVLLTLLENRL